MTTQEKSYYAAFRWKIEATGPAPLSKALQSKALQAREQVNRELVELLVKSTTSNGWKFVIDHRRVEDFNDARSGFVARDGEGLVEVYFLLDMSHDEGQQYLELLAEQCGLPLAGKEEEAAIREHMRQVRFGPEVQRLAECFKEYYLGKYFIEVSPSRKEASFVATYSIGGEYYRRQEDFELDHLESPEERRRYLMALAKKHNLPLASQEEEEQIRQRLSWKKEFERD